MKAAVLRAPGAPVACDLNPAKLEVAVRVGATETVGDAAELRDLDYVFDAIGQIETTEAAIAALAQAARP